MEDEQVCMCNHQKRYHADDCGSCINCDCQEFEIGPVVDWEMLSLGDFVKMLKLMTAEGRNFGFRMAAMQEEIDSRDEEIAKIQKELSLLQKAQKDETIQMMWDALNSLGASLPMLPPR